MMRGILRLVTSSVLLFLLAAPAAYAESTFNDMKEDVEEGGWEVIWSESLGLGDAAALAACVKLGCAQQYLTSKLDSLLDKVGLQLIEQALRHKGKTFFGPGKLEVEAGTAYWSVFHRLGDAKITTERYVRLYVKYRKRPASKPEDAGSQFVPDRVDAGVEHPNGNLYLFRAARYHRFDPGEKRFDKVGETGRAGWREVPEAVDAALLAPNGYAYFFKGEKYHRFDFKENSVDKVGIIGKDGWKGVPKAPDAAILHPNGKVYFFKGEKYHRFDTQSDTVDKVGVIGEDAWKGVPKNVDGAVLHPNGDAYLFKGDHYYRFDFTSHKVVADGVIGKDAWRGT